MKEFTEIKPNNFDESPFRLIGRDWTLITAGNMDSYNTMTASWGGMGILWNKPAVTIYVRHSRYTYDFIEKNDLFTLSFYSDEYRKALNFCGSKSGRDYDKAKETGLTPMELDGGIAFEEARLVFLCRKMYFQDMDTANFLDKDAAKFYPEPDYHRIYTGEVLRILKA